MGITSIPNRPSGDETRSIQAILDNFDAILATVNGNIETVNLANGAVSPDKVSDTAAAQLGLSKAGSVRRGKNVVAAEQSQASTSYGLLTTPDRVSSVVLPTDGLIIVAFQALWKSSVLLEGKAAIFLGANQVRLRKTTETGPALAEANTNSSANRYEGLSSTQVGLMSSGQTGSDHTSDVTTGQIVGGPNAGGLTVIFAAAGTYDVSIQFKAGSGSVTVKERKLWVWSVGF